MITYIDKLKTTLHDLIHEMSDHYWLYVSDPKRDFSRDRKLSFEKVLEILVSMGGGSLRNELIDYFHCLIYFLIGLLKDSGTFREVLRKQLQCFQYSFLGIVRVCVCILQSGLNSSLLILVPETYSDDE